MDMKGRLARLAGSMAVLAACLACGASGVPATPPAPPPKDDKAGPTANGGLAELAAHATPGTAWGDSLATQNVATWLRTEIGPDDPNIGIAVRLVEGSPAHLVVVARHGEDVGADAAMLDELLEVVASYAPSPADLGIVLAGPAGFVGYATRVGRAKNVHTGPGDPAAELAPLFVAGTSGAPQIAPLVTGPNADVLASLNRAFDDEGEEESDDGGSVLFRYTTLECTAPTVCRLGVVVRSATLTHTATLDVSGFTTLREDGSPSVSFTSKANAAMLAWTATIDD